LHEPGAGGGGLGLQAARGIGRPVVGGGAQVRDLVGGGSGQGDERGQRQRGDAPARDGSTRPHAVGRRWSTHEGSPHRVGGDHVPGTNGHPKNISVSTRTVCARTHRFFTSWAQLLGGSAVRPGGGGTLRWCSTSSSTSRASRRTPATRSGCPR